jgi:disulfide bond formation protein DsbB
MGVALYLEHVVGLIPCPLCIIQRVLLILVGIVCLAGLIHHPRAELPSRRPVAARLYGLGVSFFAILGAAVAGRQVWLQHQPSDQLPSCLPSLDYLIAVLPLQVIMHMLFNGPAD